MEKLLRRFFQCIVQNCRKDNCRNSSNIKYEHYPFSIILYNILWITFDKVLDHYDPASFLISTTYHNLSDCLPFFPWYPMYYMFVASVDLLSDCIVRISILSSVILRPSVFPILFVPSVFRLLSASIAFYPNISYVRNESSLHYLSVLKCCG